jgi:hypothetical protein
MGANANGRNEVPIKACDEAKTGRLGEEGNEEWRLSARVPFGLLPKARIAALQSLTGRPARLRALRCAFAALQRVRVHGVNRP